MDYVVVKDPEVLSGAPIFRGTRVMISSLWDYLETGQSVEAFLDDFPTVSRAQALAVLEEAKALVETRARPA